MLKSRATKVSPFPDICASRPPGTKSGAMQFFGQFGIVQAAQGGMAIRWFVNPVELAPIGILPQPALFSPVRPLPGRPPASPPLSAPLASAAPPAPPVPPVPPLPATPPGVSLPAASIVAPPPPPPAEPPLPPPTAPPLPPDDPAPPLPVHESAARHATTPNLSSNVATGPPLN